MIRRSTALLIVVGLAACTSHSNSSTGDEPNERLMATASCPGADVTVRWWGNEVEVESVHLRLFTRLELLTGDGEVVPWIQSHEEGGTNHWPEVLFAPDCEHVAISQYFQPYVVVASHDLVAFAREQPVTAYYLEDQEPCALAYSYASFEWLTATMVQYALTPTGGSSPMEDREIRTRDFRDAPRSLPDLRCDDPNHPLYEPD